MEVEDAVIRSRDINDDANREECHANEQNHDRDPHQVLARIGWTCSAKECCRGELHYTTGRIICILREDKGEENELQEQWQTPDDTVSSHFCFARRLYKLA